MKGFSIALVFVVAIVLSILLAGCSVIENNKPKDSVRSTPTTKIVTEKLVNNCSCSCELFPMPESLKMWGVDLVGKIAKDGHVITKEEIEQNRQMMHESDARLVKRELGEWRLKILEKAQNLYCCEYGRCPKVLGVDLEGVVLLGNSASKDLLPTLRYFFNKDGNFLFSTAQKN